MTDWKKYIGENKNTLIKSFILDELKERNWEYEHLCGYDLYTCIELAKVMNGKEKITKDSAEYLGRAFDMSPEIFINLCEKKQ